MRDDKYDLATATVICTSSVRAAYDLASQGRLGSCKGSKLCRPIDAIIAWISVLWLLHACRFPCVVLCGALYAVALYVRVHDRSFFRLALVYVSPIFRSAHRGISCVCDTCARSPLLRNPAILGS